MTIRHHLSDDLLISYAAGSLAEGWSLAVATHLALCPACRKRLAVAEDIGGELLEAAQLPVEADSSWEAVRRRIAQPTPTQREIPRAGPAAGKPVPEHGHGGRELTLVLSGSFVDGTDLFARGDIEDADASLAHQPTATPAEDCICLAVTDAPLRFRSWFVRVSQPILGI